MPQIKFSVSDEAVAYLKWLARNIFFVKTEHEAAKQLMMHRLEESRRLHRRDEPGPDDLAVEKTSSEEAGQEQS